jgi:hypothetical protein
MKQLGYTDEAVNLYTQYIDLKTEIENEKLTIKEIEYQVKGSEIDIDTALQKLNEAGVDNEYAKYLVALWSTRYKHRHKAFPLSDLIKLAELHAINESDFVEELKLDGYSDKQIEWLKIMGGYKQPPKK